MTLEQIRAFWSGILTDEEMKLSDRMKAAENLAKLLPPEEEEESRPERVVVEYPCAP